MIKKNQNQTFKKDLSELKYTQGLSVQRWALWSSKFVPPSMVFTTWWTLRAGSLAFVRKTEIKTISDMCKVVTEDG